MRLVLDTNILISAFLWGGKPKILLDRIFEGKEKLYISPDILSEIKNVLLRPKFKIPQNIIHLFLQEIQDISMLVYPDNKLNNIVRDPKDHIILECALEAQANYVITGDKDLLDLKQYQSISITTANDYLALYE